MSKAAELAALIGSQSALSNRNLVINGAMQVAQRGTSTTSAAAFTFFADRFYYEQGSMDALAITTEQVADAPAGTGLKYSIKATVTTPEVGSGDTTEFAQVNMFLEHQDSSQKLSWGTSSAKDMTVSFYVKSSVTGVFLFTLHKSGGAAGFGTHYTINSANTWEKKTIAVPAATDSSWAALADTGRGIESRWSWRVGSNVTKTVDGDWDYTGGYVGFSDVSNTGGDAFVTTNGATWQLTGVQYEIGEQATPFEHRPFSDELARCQRYAYVPTKTLGLTGQSGGFLGRVVYPVTMRSAPALTLTASAGYDNSSAFGNSPEANEFTIANVNSGNGVSFSTPPTGMIITEQTKEECMIGFSGASTPNEEATNPIYALKFGTGASMLLSAEV